MPRRPQGHLYRRGKIWWCWYYQGGRLVRESTRCTSKRAAELVLEERESAAAGDPSAHAAPWSVSQALQALLDARPWPSIRTAKSHASRAGALAGILGDLDVALLKTEHIEQYISARREAGRKDHSVAKELVLLRLALRAAKKAGKWAGDLERLFPDHRANYQPRERWLEPAEASVLLEELPSSRQLWLQVALYTGGRKEEVSELRWEDISWERSTVHIRGTKTSGADRVVGLAPQLRALLEPISKTGDGTLRRGLLVGRWVQVLRGLKRACARIEKRRRASQTARGEPPTASFPPVTPNDLRRTTASWLAIAGVPPLHIAKMLGHKSLDMVMRVYARVNPEALTAAAAALPSLDCDAGVLRGGRFGAQSAPCADGSLRKEPNKSELLERACPDSNRGPLASEAKSHERKEP